jgi:hypothetical protein
VPNIGDIVNNINTSLQAGCFSPRSFQLGDFQGIAEPIETIGENGSYTTPNIILSTGEATELVYDDKFPFRLFHLKDGWEYKQAPDDDNFGNAGDIMQEEANMMLVFVGSRKQMNVSVTNITAAIAMDIPKEFSYSFLQSYQLNQCTIELGSIMSNPYEVWTKIWTNQEYEFDTDTIAFIMNYKIRILYKRGCFNLCATENNPYYS